MVNYCYAPAQKKFKRLLILLSVVHERVIGNVDLTDTDENRKDQKWTKML